jgi:hypothetical protein
LTVNFSTIIVGRAGEPVSVLNLDAPQLISAIVTELLHYSQESLWAIALLPTAFGKSTADGASGIQMERRDSDKA